MKKTSFVWTMASTGADLRTLLLAASIRKFAGSFSASPLWVLVPSSGYKLSKELKDQLLSLDIQIIPFSVDPEVSKFPFAGYVLATAVAESLARNKTEFLVWLNSDTLVFNEPTAYLLDENKNLGYRPVHHTLVGSIYGAPIDPFWDLIYRKCGVLEEKIFPMKTHVDHNILRPYFNAGCLIVRPQNGLFQAWWNSFKELYRDPNFEQFYETNRLYTVFIHQAILAGVILSTMDPQELQELPFNYNYPLHLYFESPSEYQPQNLNELITARYEELPVLDTVPLQEPLKSWLKAQLNALSKNPSE
jgi:hypothetical protein